MTDLTMQRKRIEAKLEKITISLDAILEALKSSEQSNLAWMREQRGKLDSGPVLPQGRHGREKLIIGYAAASEVSGISDRPLQRLVERRVIRVAKPNRTTIAFFPSHLHADIAELENEKI